MNPLSKIQYLRGYNKQYIKSDILSGITVALALIPEAVAFAFVAGVSPLVSLQTAVIIGVIAAIFSGRPGMISSSTAAIAVVVAPLVASYGMEYLFATVVLMGLIQMSLGLFKLGKYTSIIPHSVVLGFLNGLAILIFRAQLDQFKVRSTEIIEWVETTVLSWLPTTDLLIMGGFVLVTMAIIHYFPRLTKAVPSTLVGIATITGVSLLLAHFGIYELQTVADFAGGEIIGALPSFHIPDFSFSWEAIEIILPFAIVGALVGLTEATLTLRVLDEMTDTRGQMNREYMAQGFANVVNGFFGGMGWDAMVGQSIINIKSWGRQRLSGLVAALALLLFLLFAAPLVNAIPLASLVGLMFIVVISTFERETLTYGGKLPRWDIIVTAVVSIVTIFADLATAVIVGVILSALMFAWEKGKSLAVDIKKTDWQVVYVIRGILFFGSCLAFKELFDVAGDPDEVIIDLGAAKVMDQSAIQALKDITSKYETAGKKATVRNAGKNCEVLIRNAEHVVYVPLER